MESVKPADPSGKVVDCACLAGALADTFQPRQQSQFQTFKTGRPMIFMPQLDKITAFDGNKQDCNVWHHFTKIQTEDREVVYGACHHCDKLLKAHPRKHGVSQLKRHRNSAKCRSSYSNPSTDEDLQMLRLLRTELDLYKQQKMDGELECEEVNASLTMLNPWDPDLNPCYVTTSMNRKTNQGCWEEMDEFTAIRMQEQLQVKRFWTEFTASIQMDQLQVQVPQYIGLRRTLEFHHNQNGNKLKTSWIMLEYQQVDDNKSPVLLLQGDMVIRKVFHYDKDAVASAFSELDRLLSSDDDDNELCYNVLCLGEAVSVDITMSSDYMHDGTGARKHKRTDASNCESEVWTHFTEIYTTDPDLVYTVCHFCDRGSKGAHRNDTSYLTGHKNMCLSKPPGTGNVDDTNATVWEAEIWPRFLLFNNPILQEL